MEGTLTGAETLSQQLRMSREPKNLYTACLAIPHSVHDKELVVVEETRGIDRWKFGAMVLWLRWGGLEAACRVCRPSALSLTRGL